MSLQPPKPTPAKARRIGQRVGVAAAILLGGASILVTADTRGDQVADRQVAEQRNSVLERGLSNNTESLRQVNTALSQFCKTTSKKEQRQKGTLYTCELQKRGETQPQTPSALPTPDNVQRIGLSADQARAIATTQVTRALATVRVPEDGQDGQDGVSPTPTPGPQGPQGEAGQNGQNGSDGQDGTSVQGAPGEPGESIVGPQGPGPTDEQIAAAVDQWFDDNEDVVTAKVRAAVKAEIVDAVREALADLTFTCTSNPTLENPGASTCTVDQGGNS